MQNYNYDGFHQFPTNINGLYRFAVVSDVVLSGPGNHLHHFNYFIDRAVALEATDILYINRDAMSHECAALWPVSGLPTWCRHPPAPNSHDRDDIVPAPPGFVLARRGMFRPVYLHYHYRSTQINGIHLVGGVPDRSRQELPSGGMEVTCGCFTIVELQLDESGDCLCDTMFWKPHKTGDREVTRDTRPRRG